MLDNNFKSDFIPCDPNVYTGLQRDIGPDGIRRYCIYNEEKYKYAYIYNKRYTEDDSQYAPYLTYLIGKKTGIDVPETELRACLVPSMETGFYRDAFYQSSLVYVNDVEREQVFNEGKTFFPFSVVKSFYYQETGKTENISEYDTIDDYINANMYYFSTRQKTPMSSEETQEIKQKLIDNLMFGLKLGVSGDTEIIESKYHNPRLNSFYLTSSNMLCLNLRTSKTTELADAKVSDLKEFAKSEFPVQYSVTGDRRSSVEETIKYLYEKYPEETEKSYNKLKQYGVYNLKNILDGFSEMDDSHKKLALRLFQIRQKEFFDIHKECTKSEETR